MIGFTKFDVYHSIFDITEQNNSFDFYTDNFDEFSFEELKEEFEEILSISDIKPSHLQHEKVGSRKSKASKKLRSEKSSTDRYTILLMAYARSPFRDFESYLRIIVGSGEDNIQLFLKQDNFEIIRNSTK